MSSFFLGFDARLVRHWTDALNAPAKITSSTRKAAIDAANIDKFMIVFEFVGTNPDDLILKNQRPVINSSLYVEAERKWRITA
jgi:hypothetical protein